jgi:oligopeptide/dipeptide ABC transporter ATP-binding protein
MPNKILEVHNLKKYFKSGTSMLHAVDDVSFFVEEGKTLGIVGESGCGKSTTGRCVLRLLEPTSGQVIFDGKDICKMGKREIRKIRKDMQIIFQDPYSSLNPRKTVLETIKKPIVYNNLMPGATKKQIEDQVLMLMDTVGLAERLVNTYPHELDGGRRQRIGIARALAMDPRFIVCDEPVSALDVSIQSQVLNLLKDLQAEFGLTYLFIAHGLNVVKHVSDRVGVMYLGKLVELTDGEELYAHPLHPYTRALLSAIPVPDPKAKKERIILTGDVPSPINPPKGCRFHSRCPEVMEVCRYEDPEFREVQPRHLVACHLNDK